MGKPSIPDREEQKPKKQAKPKRKETKRYYVGTHDYMTDDTVIYYRDNNGVETKTTLGELAKQGKLFVSSSNIPYSHGFETDE